ncbi:hypothetical protein TRICI_002159 [Trichomonascus ciferrii]|uniref:Brl1/Brr6 domain-containing protein n=1 Tax=Trichomonascus ciferrii TaxID=44093 RepID=A0A642V6M1_9ASCO|nr:hypothetical protein TRICI_002159 [Trichomonascus ciferrii]
MYTIWLEFYGGILDSINDVERRDHYNGFEVDSIKESLLDVEHGQNKEMEDYDISMEDYVPEPDPTPEVEMTDYKEEKEKDIEEPPLTPRKVNYLLSPTELGARMAVGEDRGLVLFQGDEQKGDEQNTQFREKGCEKETKETQTYNMDARTDVSESKTVTETMDQGTAAAERSQNMLYLVSTYLQLLFNVSLVLIALYVVSSTLITFWRDVDKRIEAYSSELLVDVSQCTRLYLENDCRPDIRPPALHEECTRLEKCMDMDVGSIRRMKVSAETLAEIIDSFINTFSYKTLGVVVFALIGASYVANVVFGFARAKAYYHRSRPQHTQFQPPSNTPMGHTSAANPFLTQPNQRNPYALQ